MRRLALAGIGAWVVLGACADESPGGAASATPAADPLEGAWQVTEITRTTRDGKVVTSPRPGLRLFADGQYTWLYINSDTLRSKIPEYDSVTLPQILGAFGPVFSANGGPYTVSGDTITFALAITKNPNLMFAGSFRSGTYRIVADSLWITDVATNEGPTANPTTMKHVRLHRP